MKILSVSSLVCFCYFLSSCSSIDNKISNQQVFYNSLKQICGKSFEGKMVSNDKQDSDVINQKLIMHVRDCSEEKIEIPFNIGENRSRTWIIRKFENQIELKHNHVHEDGTLDKSTYYGGLTASQGTNIRQEFPADEYSKQLFEKNNIPQSKNNIWAVEIIPNKIFAYELRRENRFFRVEFDLSKNVNNPPKSWGK